MGTYWDHTGYPFDAMPAGRPVSSKQAARRAAAKAHATGSPPAAPAPAPSSSGTGGIPMHVGGVAYEDDVLCLAFVRRGNNCTDCKATTTAWCEGREGRPCLASDRIPRCPWPKGWMTPFCLKCEEKAPYCRHCRADEEKAVRASSSWRTPMGPTRDSPSSLSMVEVLEAMGLNSQQSNS